MLTLAACGGGGSGGGDNGGNPPNRPDGSWLTFSPAAGDVTTFEGESVRVKLLATSTRQFAKPFSVGIVDAAGVISTDMDIYALSTMQYEANLNTSTTLKAGISTTNLEVRLCEDDPRTCRSPLPGSPWYVPLKVTVKPRQEGAARLTLTYDAARQETYPNESLPYVIQGKLTADLASYNVAVIDPKGVLESSSSLARPTLDTFRANFNTKPGLAAGEHTTNVEVRVCRDNPAVCAQPASGSPWMVPVTVLVKSGINLTQLQPMAQLSAWSTHMGNAAHNGYVPATFDATKFTRRWTSPEGDITSRYTSIAIDNGMVVYGRTAGYNGTTEVAAIREDTGEIAWRAPMGQQNSIDAPAAANGRVFVASSKVNDNQLWSFNVATGAVEKKVLLSSQGQSYLAPTVLNNDVLIGTGYYGGMAQFDATTLERGFSISLAQVSDWTPSAASNTVYAYLAGELVAIPYGPGPEGFRIPGSNPVTWRTARAVALGDGMAFAHDGEKLIAFNLATRSVAWTTAASDRVADPAVANGVVYFIHDDGTRLEARAAATGEVLWTSAAQPAFPGSYFRSYILVTDNLAFMSGPKGTVAIDLKTHAIVWSDRRVGELSISRNGVLYIRQQSGAIAAINLR